MFVVQDTGGGGDFVPHPEGAYPAVCVDVVDRGIEQTGFGAKHRCQIAFETTAKMEDGQPFIIRSKKMLASLSEKANLRKFLVQWRGKDFTEEQLKGFDLEKLIGAPAFIQVVHTIAKDGSGKVYANISAIMKLPDGMLRLTPSAQYQRVKDRVAGSPMPAANGAQAPRPAVTAGQSRGPMTQSAPPAAQPRPSYDPQMQRSVAPLKPPTNPLWDDEAPVDEEDELPF